MATRKGGKKVAPKKVVKSVQASDVREISFVDEEIEPPPIVRESKYPWRRLADAEPLKAHFFVACESEEEAKTLRTSVYASGRVYFVKRKMELIPLVRVMQKDDTWGVGAWAILEEPEGEE